MQSKPRVEGKSGLVETEIIGPAATALDSVCVIRALLGIERKIPGVHLEDFEC